MPARVAHDPPAAFDARAGVVLPPEATSGLINVAGTWISDGRPPVALHRDKVFIATQDRVLVFDTALRMTRNLIGPQAEPFTRLTGSSVNTASAPHVTSGASPLLLAPFLVRQPGSGTKAARNEVELVAADAATGQAAWHLTLPFPEWGKDGSYTPGVAVVGSSGSVAVVTATYDSVSYHASTTYAVDLTARRLLWTQDAFEAAAVTDGLVTGPVRDNPLYGAGSHASGRDLATGTERWRGEDRKELALQPAGPHLLLAQGRDVSDYQKKYTQFLDTADGTVKQDLPKENSGSRCRPDGETTVVCTGGSNGPSVTAFDAATGAILWKLPDSGAGRIAPEVTSVWHGRVYGRTPDGSVALDARTGADLPAPPGVAPVFVNGYTGVALAPEGHRLMAYATTG
ncbi:PQQ-binding-like beta-propeller repeat protein [Streptomyces sp. NPDC058157]|uniref:outer membrane protein assembly factor BamB family protein n=1 Tax=Streptomyces sp. NPDC058157 TaxID=3346360 RepID=UPI0036E12C4D